jgi:hypothetical protein
MNGFVGELFNAGFRARRRGPFVSAKGPKTISASARPKGGPSAPLPNQDGSETRCAQTVFATEVGFGKAAPPRPKVDKHSRNSHHVQTWLSYLSKKVSFHSLKFK